MVQISRVLLPEYTGVDKIVESRKSDPPGLQMTIHKFEMENNTVIHSIVFMVPNEEYIEPKEGKKTKMFMKNLQYRLVGPYLCYRYYTDESIRIRKVLKSSSIRVVYSLLNGEKVEADDGEVLPSEERRIDLKPLLFEPEDKKYVTFHQIPSYSFQTVKAENEFYNCLLEITMRNDVYIFDLESKVPKEINFI